MNLTLIIPTFNERDIIEGALLQIADAFKFDLCQKTEVLIIDDGTDGLSDFIPQIAQKFPFRKIVAHRNSPPLGKGLSVARGIEIAQGDIVGFLDVDLSTPPSYIFKALESLMNNRADVFIASRKAPGSSVQRKQFFVKDILGHLLGYLARGIIFSGMRNYTDTQCGFKFFKADVAKVLYHDLLAHDGMTDLEVLIRANLLDLQVEECGVQWTDVRESKRKLRRILKGEILSMLRILCAYKLRPQIQRAKLEKWKTQSRSESLKS